MDHNVTIGAKVKAFRTAKKYTLKQLSEESGLSIGFLSQLERGLSSIAIDSLAKLATILGVSLSSFFDSSADQEKSPVSRSFAMHCSQINPQIVQYLVNGNAQGFACLPRIFHLMPSATTSSENQLEMNQHDGEEFIYRYSEDAEGNPSLENIEDDEEYEVVSDRFDELLDEAEFEDLDD